MDYVLVFKAASILERDFFVTRMKEAGLRPITDHREVSRKITNTTVDLSLGGYSTFFDGFSIFVPEYEKEKATAFVEKLVKEDRGAGAVEIDHVKKFYASAIFGFFIPVVFHVIGFYHFKKALEKKQKFQMGKMVISIVLYAVGLASTFFYIQRLFSQLV